MILTLALLAASLAGLGNGVYGSYVMSQLGRGCATGCPLVMGTRYARIFGFPNSWIAAAYFAALTLFAALRLAGVSSIPFWAVLAASGIALLMTLYLAWALLIKLKQT